VPTSNLDEGFKGVNWALLVGAVPRKAGMERKDLLGINGKIFTGQGQCHRQERRQRRARARRRQSVQHQFAHRHEQRARRSRDRFFAMTMLDENRAKSQLAKKAGVDVTAVTNLAIWGNHSADDVSRFLQRENQRPPVPDVIRTRNGWKGISSPPCNSAARPSSRRAV
jgi:malate dehydrogenase